MKANPFKCHLTASCDNEMSVSGWVFVYELSGLVSNPIAVT